LASLRLSTKAKDASNLAARFDFHFIGLIGLADPIRNTVPSAISECYNAGIRVIMIPVIIDDCLQYRKANRTENPEQFITGSDLYKTGAQQLAEKLKTINVFSRVVPEQKLLIIDALKANGEVVAMTGDGVNERLH